MKGRRLPLGSALILSSLATVTLQVLVLVFLGIKSPGPIISQSLQAVSAFLAGIACLQASFRSTAFARSFWRLSSAGFLFWSVAQTIGTYHLYVALLHPQAGPRGIVLYFFSFTPLFAALFLSPGARDQDTRWESYLDFLQILVVTATFYLLFLYSPWWQLSDQEWVARRSASVNLRNLLLCAGFFVRIVTARSIKQRELYARVGIPIFLYSLGFWIGKRGISVWSNQLGSWFDLGWTLPFVLIVVLAEGWQEGPAEEEFERAPGYVPILLASLLALSLPVVTGWLRVVGGLMSNSQALLICGAVAAIIICFFSRLTLSHFRQQKTLEQLRDSEQRMHAALEAANMGAWEWTAETNRTTWSRTLYDIYGVPTEHHVESPEGALPLIHPEDRTRFLESVKRCSSTGEIYQLEYRIIPPDGKVRWILDRGRATFDSEGRVLQFHGVVQDVTERKEAERALQDSREQLQFTLDAASGGKWEWTPENDRVIADERLFKLYGLTPEVGFKTSAQFMELVHREDRESIREAARMALRKGEGYSIEFRVRLPDGGERWLSGIGRTVADASGRVQKVRGITFDVTDRRKLEEQLRQAQKMEAVGRLAGGLAHDYNNLLTVIKGYSRMVLDDPQCDEKMRGNVEHIDGAAERAASLTRHLLAFSRKQVLQPKVLDLNALIVDLDKMLRRLIGEDVEVLTVTAPNLGSVVADPGQIEQVIMNLVVNARDAMPNGGKLTLETANVDLDAAYSRDHDGVRAGAYVMLAVSDTGIGMDAQTLSHIFEPFFTTKELGRGTGLGLSTVYGIVSQSGGHIWVYSEPGEGTTFKIYFARVADPAQSLSKAMKPAETVRGQETVLLVEDDEQVRELTHMVLTSAGYSVLVAANEQAISKICSQYADPVHLLLTDVVMPGINGREVAKRVSARWPKIKVLYMSGYTENAIGHHGVLDTDTFFLPKPFTPSMLTYKLREVLNHNAAKK